MSVNLISIYMQAVWFLPSYLLVNVLSCHRVAGHLLLSRGGLVGFSSLGSLFNMGLKTFEGIASQLRVMSWEVLSLPSSF